MKTRQAHQSPPASPPPPVLPDELMVEILSWLPVKSLLKFRCVCKSWKSTISDPNFVKLHLHRSARNANLLLVSPMKPHNVYIPCSVRYLLANPSSSTNDEEEYCFLVLGGDDGYKVVGSSCNGLVCLVGGKFPEYRCYLYNPATRFKSKYLPCLRVGDSCRCHRFLFGYDNSSNTYKVLAFIFNSKTREKSQKKQVKICSLSDNSWRNLHSFPFNNPFYDFNYLHNNGAYFNGTLNWLALCKINSDVIAQLVIVSLDLGMETCTQLLLPRLDESLPANPTIGVLMDCLCFSHDSNTTHFVVWQMKEFGVENSWTQFMKVSYHDLQFDCLEFPLIPLCTSENGDVLIITTMAELQAILYHRRDNRVERTKLPEDIRWHCTLDYVESLVSPSSEADMQP